MVNQREVTERTLELNVCAELIRCIRSYKDCGKAVWIGMTQKEERKNGLDVMTKYAPGRTLWLQFKSPQASSIQGIHYKFAIDREQHEALLNIGPGFRESVFYAFPLYSRWSKIRDHSPCLLQDTWLIPVQCVTLNGMLNQNYFQINLTRIGPQIQADGASLSVNCNAINAKERFCDSTSRQSDRSIFEGTPSETLRHRASEFGFLGTKFKGLNAIHVPYDQSIPS